MPFLQSKDATKPRRIALPSVPWPASEWKQILLVEDNSARAQRRQVAGVSPTRKTADVVLRLHKITPKGILVVSERAYSPGTLESIGRNGGRTRRAIELLDEMRMRRSDVLIVAGPDYGGSKWFIEQLTRRGFDWVVELPRKSPVCVGGSSETVAATELLAAASWKPKALVSPATGQQMNYAIADLGPILLSTNQTGRLFAAQNGAIQGLHNGTIVGLTSVERARPHQLLLAVGWARWIRLLDRQHERNVPTPRMDRTMLKNATGLDVRARANITVSRQQDEAGLWNGIEDRCNLRGVLRKESHVLNVLELFAGAGGMGLGFLLAGDRTDSYRLTFSGEVHPIYVETLRRNHCEFKRTLKGAPSDLVPASVEPVDLRTGRTQALIESYNSGVGDTHILVGGPPCQGFSSANRNSWHGDNPHNQLVDVFLKYVERLKPRVFLMENVQGILWTPRGKASRQNPNVVSALARKMERIGYLVFPKLLDAVWFGVPQYRSRFFLLGIHKDLGYRREDFGAWGPFPCPTHGPGTERPYTTVRDAIADLPRIGNGHQEEQIPYTEPTKADLCRNPYLTFVRGLHRRNQISDHVTSRHADYVIERYREIPAGGNWEDISHSLTNYAAVERTHSNIYRRLDWDHPSITIGHYRKSMLVHPRQHRGLSLREASRLQSFPDWFRFSGAANGKPGGLEHKQQQLYRRA